MELEITCKASCVSCVNSAPLETFLIVSEIKSAIWFDASDAWAARLRTSSATTSNPFPCSPALDASTAALSARIFVLNAISLITLITFWIFTDASLISPIAITISCIFSFPSTRLLSASSTILVTSSTRSAFNLDLSAISVTDVEICSNALACCVDPCARLWLAAAIWLLPVWISPAVFWTLRSIWLLSWISFTNAFPTTSSLDLASMSTHKLPSATWLIAAACKPKLSIISQKLFWSIAISLDAFARFKQTSILPFATSFAVPASLMIGLHNQFPK